VEPAGLATAVWVVARETGWPEHKILWDLPLARLNQLEHVAMRSAKIECRWFEGGSKDGDAVAEFLTLAGRHGPQINRRRKGERP